MSVYLWNFFRSLKTTVILLLYDMVWCNGRFFSENNDFWKLWKCLTYPQTLSYLWKYFINQYKNCIFMIRQEWSLNDQNLQSVTILHKKLKSLIFSFFTFAFSFFFFLNIFHFNIRLFFHNSFNWSKC